MKPKVLILGTFHFVSQLDLVNAEFSPEERQHEILQLVNQLKEFKPTKIAVEATKDRDKIINAEFQEYINGSKQLKSNEIYQVGFRLAKSVDHEKVYPVDWMENIGQPSIGEVMEFAKEHQPDIYHLIMEEYISNLNNNTELPIVDVLKEINDDEHSKFNRELYLHLARIGEGTNYVGVDYLKWWYQRNLIIYSNISELVESEQDRILLLIGAGHIYLVKQFLMESGLFEVEDVLEYLK